MSSSSYIDDFMSEKKSASEVIDNEINKGHIFAVYVPVDGGYFVFGSHNSLREVNMECVYDLTDPKQREKVTPMIQNTINQGFLYP